MSTDVVNQIKIVDFHGHKLQTFEHDGERYVVMRPVVEGMGVSWQGQREKFHGQDDYWGIRQDILPDAAGKQRKMVSIPLRRYPMWLASINPAKIPDPEVRARVVLFQEMSTEALYQFWMTGSATMESVTREVDPDRVSEVLEKIAEPVEHDSERTRAVVTAKNEHTRGSVRLRPTRCVSPRDDGSTAEPDPGRAAPPVRMARAALSHHRRTYRRDARLRDRAARADL